MEFSCTFCIQINYVNIAHASNGKVAPTLSGATVDCVKKYGLFKFSCPFAHARACALLLLEPLIGSTSLFVVSELTAFEVGKGQPKDTIISRL